MYMHHGHTHTGHKFTSFARNFDQYQVSIEHTHARTHTHTHIYSHTKQTLIHFSTLLYSPTGRDMQTSVYDIELPELH